MNKDGYVKIVAVVFAFLLFSRTGSASTNAKLASTEAKAANEKITALQEQLGLSGTEGTGATGAANTTHDVSAAKKSPTTTVKAGGAKAAHGTGASGAPALHWSYDGETGPATWGSLDTTYAACLEGTKQSPIDLSGAKGVDIADLVFHYEPASGSVVDNGHTIQVDVKAGDTVTTDAGAYTLVQFHFHGPSEHTVRRVTHHAAVHRRVGVERDGSADHDEQGADQRAHGSVRRAEQPADPEARCTPAAGRHDRRGRQLTRHEARAARRQRAGRMR